MPGDLIITNGDVAGELLRRTVVGAEVLPWRDVLHQGPVPQTKSLAELSNLRADYLAGRGWGDATILARDFEARDLGLAHSVRFDTVTLWFEHDLFDQLQLLQILDWFGRNGREDGTLHLVQANEFLGRQTPDALGDLSRTAQPVVTEQLALAAHTWSAFRAPAPEDWADLRAQNLIPLPFLAASIDRMLEELPGPDGLTRTERQMIAAIARGATTPPTLFAAVQSREEAPFMGDWSFWGVLDRLALADEPLIEGLEGAPFRPEEEETVRRYLGSTLGLTPFGIDVLAGRADQAEQNAIDRWWGGTHLTNDMLWRWDAGAQRLVEPR